jgi:hypothetical protein
VVVIVLAYIDGLIAVLQAVPAGGIEMLQCQTERIDHAMARAARRVRPVLLHALTD